MKTCTGAFLGSLLFLATFASVALANDATSELFRTDQEWAAAASEGKDVDRVAGFWSDDGTIAPSGAPLVVGKAAIRDYVAQSFATPGFHIGWKTLQASVSDDGTMGYTTADSTMTFPGPDGKLMTVAGRGVAIWRRDSNGKWRCVYDIWNYGP